MKSIIVSMPFDGSPLTFVTDDNKVAFSSLTVDEYLAAKAQPGKTVAVISPAEYDKLHEDFWSAPFKEITEADYDYALCVLPPLKWHDLNADLNIFFCSEATSGLMHACYVYQRKTEKYFTASKSIITPDEKMIENFYEETK